MSKKNLLILGITLGVILLVGLGSLLIPRHPALAPDAPDAGEANGPISVVSPSQETMTAEPMASATPEASLQPTEAPQAQGTEEPAAAPQTGSSPVEDAIAYMLVSVGNTMYRPIPLTEEGEYAIRQNDGAMENIVHVTRDSIAMMSSTCDNQDCVQQGTVSMENREERVLGSFIVCLPNKVTLELLTAKEAADMMTTVATDTPQ